nr:reverse transcriptase domain-containing protein [Tanacetum cinerariifolium]
PSLTLTRPAGIAEDVFVKVGKFHFPTDFVVVDYVVDLRIPLILGRPFLRTEQALIDVYGEELTLRVDAKAITFNVRQTSKYSYNDAELINQIDVIDVAYEEKWFHSVRNLDFLTNPDELYNLDHSALKYLLAKQDAKPRLIWGILQLQEFDVIIRDKKGAENITADHLSRLENPHQDELEKKEITETFPL